MANSYPIQQRFTGGQISPRLYGQVHTDRYSESLESMSNFLCLPQGPAMRRQGFAYVAPALNNTDVRLLPFKVPGSTDYCVELGPGYISILTRGASRTTPSGREDFTIDELLINGDFSEGFLAWADSTSGGLYATTVRDLKRANFNLSGADIGSTIEISQSVATSAAGIVDFKFTWGALSRPLNGAPGYQDVTEITVNVGTTPGGSDLYADSFVGSSSDNRFPATYKESGFPFIDTYFFGSDIVDVQVNTGTSDPVYVTVLLTMLALPSAFDGANLFDGFPVGFAQDIKFGSATSTELTLSTPWLLEADLGLIQYVSESGSGRMYFAHPNYPPHYLSLDNGSWQFSEMALTGSPISWSGTNWPAAVEFFQGRLWLAATPLGQSTIWASKSGSPFDFTVGTNDDDGMELPLSTTGGIKWLKGQKGLVVGTDIGEQLITSKGSSITPLDRKADKQSGWGSADIQPSLAGNDIVYVSQDRTKVRAINSTFSNASWTSIDLTWIAENITRARIVETIYVQNPNYQLWCLLADGTIVICTYDREHEIVGWQEVITDGSFLSLTKTDSVEGTVMWAGVRRNGQIGIEAIDPDESLWQFTDSWVSSGVLVTDGVGIAGTWPHLIGKTVQVVVDGAIEPDKVVNDLGFITVDNIEGARVVAGLKYNASMTTLELSGGNPAGTAMGSKRRYSRIFVQLYDSALPLINGSMPPERSPSAPMNTVQPNLSGEAEVRALGREGGGRVTIEQDLPKKCMVTGIYGKASEEQT